MFLGLTDTGIESVFRTLEGFTSPWANWKPGEPNDAANADDEDCVRRDVSNGMWMDANCDDTREFYCEG